MIDLRKNKTEEYPKTVVVRNSPDGMIWQIYHVDNEFQARHIIKGAQDSAYEGVTLEHHQPEHKETFPNWREETINSFIKMFPNDLMRASSVDDNYIDDYNDQYERELNEHMMQSEDMYGSMSDDIEDVEWPNDVRSSSPEYVIASTSFRLEETFVFEANAEGKILNFGEYGGIAKRWENNNWEDHQDAIRVAMDNVPYRFERRIETGVDGVYHFLYSKINPADFWNE